MKPIDYVLIVALALVVLVGCAQVREVQVESAPVDGESADVPPSIREPDRVSQLALGTLKLEDTENAVTPAQAAELLPLCRMLVSGSPQSDAETYAVLEQIEGTMSGPQLAAINMMELEKEDVQAWMQEQGLAMPAPLNGPGSADGQGGPGMLQNLSEEERAKMREEFQNMSAEERATRMVERPEGDTGARPGGDMRQSNALFSYLVEFLVERAAA
jgi:hypothetical protein